MSRKPSLIKIGYIGDLGFKAQMVGRESCAFDVDLMLLELKAAAVEQQAKASLRLEGSSAALNQQHVNLTVAVKVGQHAAVRSRAA